MKTIYTIYAAAFLIGINSANNVNAQGYENFANLTTNNNAYAVRTFTGNSPVGSDAGANGTWTANRAQANQVGSPLIISTRNGTVGNILLPELSSGVGQVKVVFARRYAANSTNAQGQIFYSTNVTTPVWTAVPTTFTIPSVQDQLDSIIINVNINGPLLLKIENITDPGDNNNSRIGIQNITWSSFGNPLPTVLSLFTATTSNNTTTLNWVTEMEKNAAYFNVERSKDGILFTTIANVKAQNTIQGSKYAYYDYDFVTGPQFYRLKMVDFDEKYTISNTIRVNEVMRHANAVTLTQNIVTTWLSVLFSQIPQNAKLQIWSVNGTLVWDGSTTTSETKINTENFAQGVYILKVYADKEVHSFKFVKQ